MIKNFNTYNESIKDKMKGKELKGILLEINNAKDQLESLNLKTTNFSENRGIYSFSIVNIKDIRVNIYYYHKEKMINKWSDEYMNDQEYGWNIYIQDFNKYDSKTKREKQYHLTGNWNELLLNIIDACYPNVDGLIKKTNEQISELQSEIESNEKLLKGLHNVKKILDNNDN